MHDLRLVHQPVVDLDDGAVVGYEALARFGDGARSPAACFDAADEAGERASLEAFVLERVLDSRGDVPSDAFLAVNISPDLLLGGPVWTALIEAGDLTGLVVELTEHHRVEDLHALRRRLDTIRDSGCTIALDDVGTGWSGLQQVVELRPDIVKVDRSLVAGLHEDPARSAVTEFLGAFTEKLGGVLLAEGIEEVDELSALMELDVQLGQGYLLGRPQSGWPDVPAAAAEMLATQNCSDEHVISLATHGPTRRRASAMSSLEGDLPHLALVVEEGRCWG